MIRPSARNPLITRTGRRDTPISPREKEEVLTANRTGRQPVVFLHGLWTLAESWRSWRDLFDERGYATVAADWPGDPGSVEQARRRPQAFGGTSVGAAADHVAELIGGLSRRPVLVGHSFGGQLAEILAGRGLAVGSVSIDRAPGRGIRPLPLAMLRSSFPVLGNPVNRGRAVTLTYEQFRYAFANAVSATEARDLYDAHHVAAPGLPFFQAALGNLNPRSETGFDVGNPDRGPMLLMAGGRDHTAPPAISRAAYHRQRTNPGVTELVEFADRGHSLVLDSGWRDIAEATLGFLARQGVQPS
ncbi:non-heme chloroperoxidase [Marmoricola sp. URHA0025 HA25]